MINNRGDHGREIVEVPEAMGSLWVVLSTEHRGVHSASRGG